MDPRPVATRVAEELLHVRRVFGEPVERNGVTVLPVARVSGGAGGGYGEATVDGSAAERGGGQGGGTGGGDGFGIRVRPLGVYVIDQDRVRWEPALDLQRIILGGQVVGAVAVVALAWALRRRR